MRELCTVGDVVGKTYLPQGYVKANGATVQRADYPRLVNLANRYNLWTATPATYPALFGKGDGSTTLVLPDCRGVVMRFVDDGKGYDPGRVLGTYQDDMTAQHTHPAVSTADMQGEHEHTILPSGKSTVQDIGGSTGGSRYQTGTSVQTEQSKVTGASGSHKHNITTKITSIGGAETRAKNIAVQAVMRY